MADEETSPLADAARRLRALVGGARAQQLYEALGRHAADAATGGAIFLAGATAAQLVQRALHIHAATRVLPHAVGALAVGGSSVVALHFASLPREVFDQLAAERAKLEVESSWWRWLTGVEVPSRSAAARTNELVRARIEDLADAPYPAYMVMGLVSFMMLGGRLSALAPSYFADLGAFHLKKASLPATVEYATSIERGVIQEFGRLYGCHTCGIKRGVRFHADHQPPKKVASLRDSQLLRRLTGRQTAFRFYPQCEPCSNQQAHVVKQATTTLRTHLRALRLYHSTGVWLVLLCTGGLYVGGSSFHETSDVAFTGAATDANSGEPSADTRKAQSTTAFSVLTSLRERERELRKQRRQIADPSNVADIDKELDAIEACKTATKANNKR